MNLLFFQVRLFTVRVRLKLRASVALSPVFSLWEIENKRLQTVEKKFLIHSEDGYEDIDIGYLFGLYAVLKYFAVRSLDWEEIDQEINYLVDKYRRNS